ncbi:MFS siderophore iron transporter [Apiospora kogelbergensis]|uniref:MFS siderophore iron transporter n=1 Tax=Apiospora kogelbergensis TaxID=1337665 RepID=UPI003132548A
MLVPGFLILTILILWETLLATKPMPNTALVKNRTVIGACLLDAPSSKSISQAGYVDGAFLVVSGLLMVVVDHQHVAAALALLNVADTVGGALGATISGAIWANLKDIYDDLATQPSYVVGSPTRVAILLICRRYVTDLSEIRSLSFTNFVILKIISGLLYSYVVEDHKVLRRQCRPPFFGQEPGAAALAASSILVDCILPFE